MTTSVDTQILRTIVIRWCLGRNLPSIECHGPYAIVVVLFHLRTYCPKLIFHLVQYSLDRHLESIDFRLEIHYFRFETSHLNRLPWNFLSIDGKLCHHNNRWHNVAQNSRTFSAQCHNTIPNWVVHALCSIERSLSSSHVRSVFHCLRELPPPNCTREPLRSMWNWPPRHQSNNEPNWIYRASSSVLRRHHLFVAYNRVPIHSKCLSFRPRPFSIVLVDLFVPEALPPFRHAIACECDEMSKYWISPMHLDPVLWLCLFARTGCRPPNLSNSSFWCSIVQRLRRRIRCPSAQWQRCTNSW